MGRPRMLDLFCCEGGAGVGYHRAGWDVTGVDMDKNRIRRYPFTHFVADAFVFVEHFGSQFDAIHASPPCQGYSRGNAGKVTDWPLLIGDIREALKATGLPYVIENVTWAGLFESIPPAYTEFIGRQLLEQLEVAA